MSNTQPAGLTNGDSGARAGLSVAVTATFTAEPIALALRFWFRELGAEGPVHFAPYSQVFQQLLDPHSLLADNRGGVNLVLVRFEDWTDLLQAAGRDEMLRHNAAELSSALRSFARRCVTPTIVWVAPALPAAARDPGLSALTAEVRANLEAALAGFDSLHWLGPEALDPYLVDRGDAGSNRVGNIPFSPQYYAALATAVARRVHLIRSVPHKVLALDCDNTLWQGVVGEDGPHGISLPPGKRALQEFAVEQQRQGMLLALVSKNAESDVDAAFEGRPDMPLRPEHIAARRVGWRPKSQGIAELAEELNLDLDAFVFLDDNPLECAEVRAALPDVLTLQLPAADADIPEFLRHVWAFDRRQSTDEDRRRTLMYRQNAERSRYEREAAGVAEFLAGLRLRVDVAPPDEDEWARVAQLTERTNQFNLTTIRRTEAQVRGLKGMGLECLRVRVSDRFGDYGLVGVLIFGAAGDALRVDTMLLSCRALGRGIEHAMLAHLGVLTVSRGLATVEVPFAPTARNEPAGRFLLSVKAACRRETDAETIFRLPAASAAQVVYAPGAEAADGPKPIREGDGRKNGGGAAAGGGRRNKSVLYSRIGAELRRVEAVQRAAEADALTARPPLPNPPAEPRTAVERELAALLARLLHLDRVGVEDEFEALGGTSLVAAGLFAEIDKRFGVHLPMTTILEAPTVRGLALRIEQGARASLKLLRPGAEGGPALFLVHDGDGETLLYAALARRLPGEVAVYSLEPHGTGRCPLLHTRVPAMAAHYVEQVRQAHPQGPLFLGGLCAGGVIAFEMALQLQAEGRPAGFVALLDSAAPHAERRPGLTGLRRKERFLEALRDPRGGSLPGRLARRLVQIAAKVRNLAAYEAAAWARRLSDEARFRLLRRAVDRTGRAPWYLRGPSVRTVYEMAEREYAPSDGLKAPVILFLATEGTGDDEPFRRLFADPLLGWDRHVAGGPEVVETPGGHSSMLREPHLSALAERLWDRMERALAAEVGA